MSRRALRTSSRRSRPRRSARSRRRWRVWRGLDCWRRRTPTQWSPTSPWCPCKIWPPLAGLGMVFEGVPEMVDLKREVLAAASKCLGPEIIIASTTSTILVDDLSSAVDHRERFLNVHWLNPAYLIPLVEISPGAATDPAVVARVKALLEG